jgi:hypothetical protein
VTYRIRPREPAGGKGNPKLPSGTLSQMVDVIDGDGVVIAKAHHLVFPGRGATQLDPKWLRTSDIAHNYSHSDREWDRCCPEDKREGRDHVK